MTDPLVDGINPVEADFIVKWQYGMLGGFYSALVHAMTRADDGNIALLYKAFPMEVSAYQNFRGTPGWWATVDANFIKEREANE